MTPDLWAGQSKKGNGGSKKSKKDVKCWNCQKRAYQTRLLAPVEVRKGKGPKKWKGKQERDGGKDRSER